MDILLICLWYLSGILSLVVFAKRTKQKVSSQLDLIILAGFWGPFGILISLLLKKFPQSRAEPRWHPSDQKNAFWI